MPDLSNERFIKLAKRKGLVWTLKDFVHAFNRGDVSDLWIIRII